MAAKASIYWFWKNNKIGEYCIEQSACIWPEMPVFMMAWQFNRLIIPDELFQGSVVNPRGADVRSLMGQDVG